MERTHIAFFGRRNAGKSSLVNRFTSQELSIVSDVAGTTTDPVRKTMELLPLGPVVIIDTPGIDDEGQLGNQRIERSIRVLDETDIAILVVDGSIGIADDEKQLISAFKARKIPYLVVMNKSDLGMAEVPEDAMAVSALKGEGIEELKEKVAVIISQRKSRPLVSDLVKEGDLVVLVTNTVADATVFTYDLAWQEWVLPVVGFATNAVEVVSAAQNNTSATVTLVRTKNLEEAITVQVSVSGVDGRVAAETYTVTFAAGKDTATFSVPILADGGLWQPDETFTLAVLDNDEVHQNADGAIHSQTVTLKTAMAEFDADDGDGNVNANAANATSIPVSKRPTTRNGLTLNGSDKADWYSFDVESGVEYVFELVDLLPETDEELPLQVEVMLPGESSSTAVALADCFGQPYHFTPGSSGKVALGVIKTADEPASVKYALKYREWVPATIGFTTNAIEVSEFATSVRIPVQCDMEVPLPATVAVKTRDGSAKAGEDYVALDTIVAWDEHSPSSSVKYATVSLKKLIAEYEGAFEDFEVYLDFTESEGIPGDCTNLVVKVLEADIGSVGTFSIAGYSLDDGNTVNPYQARSIPVTAGDELKVKIVRTGGNAGEVGVTLTWTDGTTAKGKMGDLETEVWIDAYIPDSEGQYVARQVQSLALTTDVKNAKTKNATLNFSITDSDTTLQTYSADKTNIAAASPGTLIKIAEIRPPYSQPKYTAANRIKADSGGRPSA